MYVFFKEVYPDFVNIHLKMAGKYKKFFSSWQETCSLTKALAQTQNTKLQPPQAPINATTQTSQTPVYEQSAPLHS